MSNAAISPYFTLGRAIGNGNTVTSHVDLSGRQAEKDDGIFEGLPLPQITALTFGVLGLSQKALITISLTTPTLDFGLATADS